MFRANSDRGLEFSLKNACLGRHLGSKLLSGETPRACFNVFLTEVVGFRLVMNGLGDTSGMFRANSDRGLEFSLKNACPGRHLGSKLLSGETPRACFNVFLTKVVGFRIVMNGFGDTSGMFRANSDRGLEFSLKNACLGRHLGSKLLSGETPRACFGEIVTEVRYFRFKTPVFGDTSGVF